MKNDRKLGVASIVLLFLNLSLAKYLLVVPSFVVQEVGNSAWMVLLLSGISGAGLFAVLAALYKPYTELGLGELSRRAMGKYFGGVLNIVMAGIILVRGAFLLRMLTNGLRTLEATNASPEFIAVFILIPVLICALKGINVNDGVSAIIIPFTVLSVAAIAVVLLPHFKVDNLMPILGEGADKVLISALGKYGGFFEIAFILIYSKYLSGYKTFKKGGFLSIAAISLMTGIFTLMYCAAVPYPASKNFFYPLYQLTRLIMAGAFMQHLEPLVVFIWAGIVLCALSTVILGAGELLSSAAGESDSTGFMPLLVIMMFFISMLPDTELDAYEIYKKLIGGSHLIYISVILLILITARGRKIEKML